MEGKNMDEKELEIQTTFNDDDLDELVEDGEIEHVYQNNKTRKWK